LGWALLSGFISLYRTDLAVECFSDFILGNTSFNSCALERAFRMRAAYFSFGFLFFSWLVPPVKNQGM